ncbi:hypothetical protein COMNV_01427 [Commensalibacter sp. Nvir]|uniref:DUF2147 domain-containing protein n=1 Tax=Commensalibacter sp. Nvir TaxID=3069817 RepID=UPI002D3141B2|nr:hypothetical protein COMNV_01427 [Commensalibacter sp. Nvir]
MRFFIAVCAGLVFLFYYGCTMSFAQSSSSSFEGLWATRKEDGVFNIFKCKAFLCGSFVGMQYEGNTAPLNTKGHSQCNLLMLKDFTQQKNKSVWVGKIMDPRNEKIYNAMIWLHNDHELKLRGYIGISLFGQTQTWYRYHGSISKDCRLNNK